MRDANARTMEEARTRLEQDKHIKYNRLRCSARGTAEGMSQPSYEISLLRPCSYGTAPLSTPHGANEAVQGD